MTETFSPYRHGARCGLPLGLYIGALFVGAALSGRIPLLGIIALGMIACVPFLAYRIIGKSMESSGRTARISTLWLSGIVAFAGAAAIAGAIMMIYFRWLDPTYIYDRLSEAATLFLNSPSPAMQQMAQTTQAMIDDNNIPTAGDFTISLMWLITFCGTILSGIISLILRIRHIVPDHRGKLTRP